MVQSFLVPGSSIRGWGRGLAQNGNLPRGWLGGICSRATAPCSCPHVPLALGLVLLLDGMRRLALATFAVWCSGRPGLYLSGRVVGVLGVLLQVLWALALLLGKEVIEGGVGPALESNRCGEDRRRAWA